MLESVETIILQGKVKGLLTLPPGQFEMAMALIHAARLGVQLQREAQQLERKGSQGKRGAK